jgi:uroporphyrin-III C-methyltransferase
LRGSEEIEFVESFGILPLVPGISSSIAVPASQGISLTKESFREFLVITGTTSSRKLSTDVALAAKSTATVVIPDGNEQAG